MSNIAELHILKTHIQELEQDVRISLSRQEIKLHDTCASREQIAVWTLISFMPIKLLLYSFMGI